MSELENAQCFSCVDSAMYQYHGAAYNGRQKALEYIDEYKRLGEPKIKCVICGNEVIYQETGNDKWTEVLVKAAGY